MTTNDNVRNIVKVYSSKAQEEKQQLVNYINNEITASVALGALGGGKVAEFSNQVANIVTSEGFVSDLVGSVGMPSENETKQEYLARAKRSFMNVLDASLKK